jgi:hypothetical protein
MKKILLFIIFFALSILATDRYKKETFGIFEEFRDTVLPLLGKVNLWHKQWTEFNVGNNYLFEIEYDEYFTNASPAPEDFTKKIKITKWDYKNNGYDTLDWNINTYGTNVRFENFIIVSQEGCCSNPYKIKYYCYKTGKYLTQFNSDAIHANVSKGERYFGYTNYRYADSIFIQKNQNKYHGIGFLISDTAILSKIYIEADAPQDFVPKMNTGYRNKKYYLDLMFRNNQTITIEVINDSLVLKN